MTRRTFLRLFTLSGVAASPTVRAAPVHAAQRPVTANARLVPGLTRFAPMRDPRAPQAN
jgi:hypothetical protein